jgi:O-acetyl-ADP-ribose deacetylase (regulator of RNase III)
MNVILRESLIAQRCKLQLVRGDITKEDVDVIVNAANSSLQHGGGLAGIISRKGGSIIQKESNKWVHDHGLVTHSEPAYTSSGNLPCRYIIHAVGPVWGSGDEDSKLAKAIIGSLRTADLLKVKSIAIPAISTGIFGFPMDKASRIAITSIVKYINENHDSAINLIRQVLFDESTVITFLETWNGMDF